MQRKSCESWGKSYLLPPQMVLNCYIVAFFGGPVDYFDTCMHELTLAGKVLRSEFPLAGSREHYSLVNGGKILAEEIPERKKLNLAL